MKRAVSILLITLLLLAAVPTFAAENGLQAGLYVSDAGTELMYLDEKGVGVLNLNANGQYLSNGVVWTETSLEVERMAVPFTAVDGILFFTYENTAIALRYVSAGEAYALGQREGTAFAGTYLAEDGRKLTLAADGQGLYSDGDGEKEVFWGSLVPYWEGADDLNDGCCYVLFDSYLCGMIFGDDAVVVSTENDGKVTFRLQAAQPTEGDQLYYGYRMTTDGQTTDLVPFLTALGMDPKTIYLKMRPDGTGHLQFMDEDNAFDFTWTEDAIVADGESTPYHREGDHIVFVLDGEYMEFAPAAEVEALLADADPEKGDVQPDDGTNELVGTWTFTKAKAMGMEIPASMMGTTMTLILKEGGAASLSTDGSESDMQWSLREDGTVVLSTAGSEIFTLTYDGTALTLMPGTDAVEMVFEKEN